MEYWDIYDKNKKKTGRTMKRNDWCLKDDEYHLTVIGAVMRPDGRYLITRRKMDKAWAPGWWEVSGGGVRAGETSREAIRREIMEETGLDVQNARGGFIFTYHRENPGEGDNYFVDVYRFEMDFDEKDIRLQTSETTDFRIASPEEIAELGKQGIFLHYDSIRHIFMPDVDQERLAKQFAFALEIDKEKKIERHTYLSDESRMENDAEHAWHMVVMAYLMREYANDKIDIGHTMIMLAIHDLIEIYAGDTYAYDEEGKKTQTARETAAADRLFGMLPEDQGREFRAIWDEFNENETPEARFAKTLDNIQPMMLNNAAHARSWVENDICLSQVLGRNASTAAGSEAIWRYAWDNFLMPNVRAGRLKDE